MRLLAAFVCSLCTVLPGATGLAPYTLEGTVRDRELRTPVYGATVSLRPSMRSVTSQDDGGFTFGQAEIEGEAELVISHPDYRTVVLPLGSLGAGAWQLDVHIARAAEDLAGNSNGRGAP